MKANEFIKRNGLKYTKERIENCKGFRLVGIEIELEKLIKSHDIVDKYKVFYVPRWNFIADYCKKNRISPFDNHNYDSAGRIYDDAMKDVESCQ